MAFWWAAPVLINCVQGSLLIMTQVNWSMTFRISGGPIVTRSAMAIPTNCMMHIQRTMTGLVVKRTEHRRAASLVRIDLLVRLIERNTQTGTHVNASKCAE